MSAVLLYGPDGQPLIPSKREGRGGNPTLGLTPKMLEVQLTQFARGRISPLARTMEWVEEHDPMTTSVAEKAKAAVTRHGYEVIKKQNLDKADDAVAEQQQQVLQNFYDNLEAGDAEDEDDAGGLRLLLKQMMKAFGQRYAVHHLIWKPSSTGLGLETKLVPLYYFENGTGRMRFVRDGGLFDDGTDFSELGGPSAWMVSKGRGASLAGVICWLFSNMPTLDLVTYCSRHGMPGFLGKTASQKDTPEWQQMVQAVYSMAAEFAGVVNGQDSIEVIDMKGGGSEPYTPLIEMMHRLLAILWRGADLSTLSKGGGVGASVQDDETAALDEDNAVWLSETLNRNITKRVIEYHFGEGAAVLVELQVKIAQADDTRLKLRVVTEIADRGGQVPMSYVRNEFQIPEAGEGEDVLQPRRNGAAPGAQETSSQTRAEQNQATVPNETEQLLTHALAEAVGVVPETLSPVEDVIKRMADLGADESITEEEFLDAMEDLVLVLPEFFDADGSALLAEALERAMGTGAIQGVRASLRKKPTTDS